MSEYQGIESPTSAPPYAAGNTIYDRFGGRGYAVNTCKLVSEHFDDDVSGHNRELWFVAFNLSHKRSHWAFVTPDGYSLNRRFGPEPISPDPFVVFDDDDIEDE